MELALTHERADFDAVASLVAMARLRPEVVGVLPILVNRNVRHFLALYGGELPLIDRENVAMPVAHLWLVDADAVQMVRGVPPETPRTVIDHHLPDSDGSAVGANVTILVERIAEANLVPDRVEATLMLLGIYEDTGSLSFAGTTPRDLRAAAWLLEIGADLTLARRFLNEELEPATRALFTALVEAAETRQFAGRSVVVAAAQADGFRDELSPLAAKLSDMHGADAFFLIVDVGDRVHFVARSTGDAIDAGAVARELGGGGHQRAAAAVIDGGVMEDVVAKVLSIAEKVTTPATTVVDIMSRGPIQTLDASSSITEASALASRAGHEGYPVVDNGVLVGMVTRQDLDRAAHHGLADAQVRRLAVAAPSRVVHPDTSAEALQVLMLDEGVGQLPVAVDGRLVGIVTRTDLLKLWPRARTSAEAASVDLDRAFSPAVRTAIRRIASEARQMGSRAFVVGGIPRDLLLDVVPGPDVDVVVEGDAVALARALAAEHGGRVTAHDRFGTAKWILPGKDHVAIDLVSARTEYYDAPTALPGVQRGSIRSDLRRRDFTINTLAADIDAERYGRILDLFGGVADLRRGQIRVLHSLSFLEDPTRILRAARLRRRLGFSLEQRTGIQARQAVDLLARVSGARLRNELLQLVIESEPGGILEDLDEIGALAAIHVSLEHAISVSALRGLDAAANHLAAFRPDEAESFRIPNDLRLAAWLAENRVGEPVMTRLAIPARIRKLVAAVGRIADDETLHSLSASLFQMTASLEGAPPESLTIAWALGSEQTRSNLDRYVQLAMGMRLLINGEDLRALGYPPGPALGIALAAAARAMLDGAAPDRASQMNAARSSLDAKETVADRDR